MLPKTGLRASGPGPDAAVTLLAVLTEDLPSDQPVPARGPAPAPPRYPRAGVRDGT